MSTQQDRGGPPAVEPSPYGKPPRRTRIGTSGAIAIAVVVLVVAGLLLWYAIGG